MGKSGTPGEWPLKQQRMCVFTVSFIKRLKILCQLTSMQVVRNSLTFPDFFIPLLG